MKKYGGQIVTVNSSFDFQKRLQMHIILEMLWQYPSLWDRQYRMITYRSHYQLGLHQNLELLDKLLLWHLRAVEEISQIEALRVVKGKEHAHVEGPHRDKIGLLQVCHFQLRWKCDTVRIGWRNPHSEFCDKPFCWTLPYNNADVVGTCDICIVTSKVTDIYIFMKFNLLNTCTVIQSYIYSMKSNNASDFLFSKLLISALNFNTTWFVGLQTRVSLMVWNNGSLILMYTHPAPNNLMHVLVIHIRINLPQRKYNQYHYKSCASRLTSFHWSSGYKTSQTETHKQI